MANEVCSETARCTWWNLCARGKLIVDVYLTSTRMNGTKVYLIIRLCMEYVKIIPKHQWKMTSPKNIKR